MDFWSKVLAKYVEQQKELKGITRIIHVLLKFVGSVIIIMLLIMGRCLFVHLS